MTNTEIDMICFNQECIAYQNQLFLYGSEERYQHAVHEEQCTNLHPFFFNKKYAKQVPALLEIKTEFEEQLLVAIDDTARKVAVALKNKLIQKSSEIYDKQLDQFREGNCEKMLQRVKNNREDSQQINFINSLFLEDTNSMKDHIIKKMRKCEEQINHSLTNLDKQITLEFQKVIKDFDFKSGKKIKRSPEKALKVESQETPMAESSGMVQEKLAEKVPAIQESQSYDQSLSESFEYAKDKYDIRRYLRTKTKPIQKTTKTIKRHGNGHQDIPEKEDQEHQESTGNNKNKNKDDDVYAIRSDYDWINILKNSISCKKLVVYYPLAEEDLIKVINKTSPKEIYINYQIQLFSNFIENISTNILKQLERFCEFWDQNEFFDEVLNNQYFPTDDFRHIKSVKKIHFSQKQLKLIPKISNIWISNFNDLQELILSQKTSKHIDSLRIEACKCCNNLSQSAVSQIFKIFKETHNLKTLILKCQVLNSQNTRLLRQLTQNNNKIQCVILELQGKFIPRRILECFTQLPLKQLSINKERNNNWKVVYMDITPITKIRTLRKLAMTNMFFTTQEVTRSEIDSGMIFILDEQVADKISKLTKLVFLDLFRCSPIYSDVVERLDKSVKSQLYHLNLSHTFMEIAIVNQLFSLPRLKELNIDRTNVPLKELLNELAKKPLLSVKKLSLFHYNGDDLDKVDKSRKITSKIKFSHLRDAEINKISTCFPNLQYLNIAFCSHLTDLPESKFKKLKYLCSNKEYMTATKMERLRHKRGIEVYLYDGKRPAWIVK